MKRIADLVLILLFIGFNSVSCEPAKKSDSSLLTPQELNSKKEKVIIIDVRTPEEFASGHIEDAVNINIFDENFKKELEAIDKDKAVSVYCKVGGRSAKAAAIMKEIGFNEVYDLQGGIKNWEKEGLEIVK